jgi:hypothetical protein
MPDCQSGKSWYPSESSARKALAGIRKRSRRKGSVGRKPSRVYRCHLCNGWHLTSVERKDRNQWKGRPRKV